MLELKELHSYYGASHILHGIDLEVKKGQVVTLLGRNRDGENNDDSFDYWFCWKKDKAGIFLEGENITGLESGQKMQKGHWNCSTEKVTFPNL